MRGKNLDSTDLASHFCEMFGQGVLLVRSQERFHTMMPWERPACGNCTVNDGHTSTLGTNMEIHVGKTDLGEYYKIHADQRPQAASALAGRIAVSLIRTLA